MKRPLEQDYTSLTAYTRALEEYCDVLAQPAPVQESVVPNGSQDWAGMSGQDAFLLIRRHADGWADVNKMMGEWLAANTPPAPQRIWVGLTDEEAQWLYDNCRTPSNLIDMTEAKLKELNHD